MKNSLHTSRRFAACLCQFSIAITLPAVPCTRTMSAETPIKTEKTLLKYHRDNEPLVPGQFSLDVTVGESGYITIDDREDEVETKREGRLTRQQLGRIQSDLRQWKADSCPVPQGHGLSNVKVLVDGITVQFADMKPREYVGYEPISLPVDLRHLTADIQSVIGTIPVIDR